MFYKIFYGFLIICAVAGCSKNDPDTPSLTYINVINAAPQYDSLLVLAIDSISKYPLPYTVATGYLNLSPGIKKMEVKDSASNIIYLSRPFENFETNMASTFFVYDTVSTSNQTLKLVRLHDDLALPENGFFKLRIINLLPAATSVDVTFIKENSTDSILYTGLPHIANVFSLPAIEGFTILPIAAYRINVRTAGSQNTLATLSVTPANLAGVAAIKGINTFYITGGAQGKPVSVGRFRHYP